jgi:hypothetical protein
MEYDSEAIASFLNECMDADIFEMNMLPLSQGSQDLVLTDHGLLVEAGPAETVAAEVVQERQLTLREEWVLMLEKAAKDAAKESSANLFTSFLYLCVSARLATFSKEERANFKRYVAATDPAAVSQFFI